MRTLWFTVWTLLNSACAHVHHATQPNVGDANKVYYYAYVQSSSSCGHCYRAYEELTALSNRLHSTVILYHTSADKTSSLKTSYPKLSFTNEDFKQLRAPRIFPTVFVFDQNGNEVFSSKGWRPGLGDLIYSRTSP